MGVLTRRKVSVGGLGLTTLVRGRRAVGESMDGKVKIAVLSGLTTRRRLGGKALLTFPLKDRNKGESVGLICSTRCPLLPTTRHFVGVVGEVCLGGRGAKVSR